MDNTQIIQLAFNYGVPCAILFFVGLFLYTYIPKWIEHQQKKDDILLNKFSDSLVLIQQSSENTSRILSLAVEEIKSTHGDIRELNEKVDNVKSDVTAIKNKVGA